MIFSTTYKDRPAIGVKAGRLTARFLPEDGGKMASLTDEKGFFHPFYKFFFPRLISRVNFLLHFELR